MKRIAILLLVAILAFYVSYHAIRFAKRAVSYLENTTDREMVRIEREATYVSIALFVVSVYASILHDRRKERHEREWKSREGIQSSL